MSNPQGNSRRRQKDHKKPPADVVIDTGSATVVEQDPRTTEAATTTDDFEPARGETAAIQQVDEAPHVPVEPVLEPAPEQLRGTEEFAKESPKPTQPTPVVKPAPKAEPAPAPAPEPTKSRYDFKNDPTARLQQALDLFVENMVIDKPVEREVAFEAHKLLYRALITEIGKQEDVAKGRANAKLAVNFVREHIETTFNMRYSLRWVTLVTGMTPARIDEYTLLVTTLCEMAVQGHKTRLKWDAISDACGPKYGVRMVNYLRSAVGQNAE